MAQPHTIRGQRPTRDSRSWQTGSILSLLPALILACLGGSTAGTPPDSGTAWTERPEDTATTPDTGPPAGVPLVLWAVRHAEKDSGDDPSLTEEGAERAQALVPLLADAPLTAVYATDLVRTQETCQPTADDHGLTVQTEIDAEEDLAEHLVETHPQEHVLHCGHSYTLPELFDALGVEGEDHVSGYGQVWIVSVYPGGETRVEMDFFGDD